MQLVINNSEFEKVFFLGLTTEPSVLGLLGTSYTKNLFSVEEFREVSYFYFKFFKNFQKLPSREELAIYSKSDEFKAATAKAFELVKDLNFNNVHREIFFKTAEEYVKEKLALMVMDKALEAAAKNDKKGLDSKRLVELFTKVAGFTMTHELPFSVKADVDKFIEQSKETEARLPTGIECIDSKCEGGILADGKFIGVICAESNMGKSLLLGNIACNIARQGKKSLIISLEMSEMVYAKRIYADLYNMDINSLHMCGDELREKINLYSDYGGVYIKEYPTSTLTVEQLDFYLDKLYQKGEKYDLICIDYLTLLAEPNSENSYGKGQILTQKCRGLSYKYKCPVLTAAQLNRSGFNKEPENDNLSESMAILMDSDFVLGLYEQKLDASQSLKSIKCMKSRISDRGWYGKLFYDKKHLRLETHEGNDEDDKMEGYMDELDDTIDD